MSGRRTAAAILAAASLTACGGGARSVPPQRGAAPAARVRVALTMHWPARPQSARRRPSFVSPSAASVIVEVNPDASVPGPITFGNAPAGGGTSTVAIDAPPGADVFFISLYDQPQTPGETATAGNELGHVRLAQTIVANATNTLNATVIGTVAAVRIGPLPNQPNVITQPPASPAAYELVGRTPATFAVAPLDAGGNVILQPDAPPAITVAVNPRAAGLMSVTPVSGTTDQFTVQAVAPNSTTYPTALVATATDANGSIATSSTVVDVTSAVYVAYANNGAPSVARFDPHGNVLALAPGAFPGLMNPVACAYDPDDRTIFVADAGAGKVLAFDEDGAARAGFSAPATAGVNGVTYDAHDGNVYASDGAGVTIFAPGGGPPRGGGPSAFGAPNAQGIAFVDSALNQPLDELAVGDASSPRLGLYAESGSAAGGAALNAAPVAVAYGWPVASNFNQSPQTRAQLYVTIAGGVAALDPFGTSIASAANGGVPFGIAVDPNTREPVVTERSGNAVTTYLDDLSAVDQARSFRTPSSLSLTQPQGVCHVF
ncbi:MAG TPA: hypothetical protein VGC96_01160 [Candidatus Elarobacter sp.]